MTGFMLRRARVTSANTRFPKTVTAFPQEGAYWSKGGGRVINILTITGRDWYALLACQTTWRELLRYVDVCVCVCVCV
jgi:hypothetical protein